MCQTQTQCATHFVILITTSSVLFATVSPVPSGGSGADTQGVFSEWMKELPEAYESSFSR